MAIQQKGFFGKLFDASFDQFITTSIIKVLFMLLVVLTGVAIVGMIISVFANGVLWRGFFMLLLSPLFFVLCVLGIRVWLEMVIVLFRIAENTTRLADIASLIHPQAESEEQV